jgi:hypothetical protein
MTDGIPQLAAAVVSVNSSAQRVAGSQITEGSRTYFVAGVGDA